MRTFFAHSITALLCFATGYLAVSWRDDGSSLPNAVGPTADAGPKMPLLSETGSDATENKTKTLLELAAKPQDLSRDHATYATLLKMEAKDFAAGANEFIALLKRMESGIHGQMVL